MNGAMLVHDELLDHYKFPRYRKVIENPHFSALTFNQSCGDRISIAGRISDGVIITCGFQGEGCVLSQAAASVLMEHIHGSEVAEVRKITAAFMQERIGIVVGPTRLRCVLLALETLMQALENKQ
ncbi:MAG: iron-sulfur cluster assembly scaffold protein [bacterium]